MDRLEVFNQYRSLLFAIAYRMLGSFSDAENMVQMEDVKNKSVIIG